MRIALIILAVLTAAIYGFTERNGFVYEDRATVTQNPTVLDPSVAVELHKPRSLSELSLKLNYYLSGLSPRAFHLTNVGFHLVNGLLVFLLARRFMGEIGATAAAAVFWLHPLQSEAVNYVTSRNELIACFFGLLALLALLRDSWSVWSAIGGAVAICAAILAKESAVGLLPAIALYGYCVRPNWPKSLLIGGGIAVGVVVVAMTVRIFSSDYGTAAIPITTRGPWAYAATQASAMWRYIWALIWPWPLTVDHDFEVLPAWLNSLSLVTLGICLYAISGLRQSAPLIVWALCFPIAVLLPRFVIRIPEYLNEHQLYVPMIGVALVIGFGWQLLSTRLDGA